MLVAELHEEGPALPISRARMVLKGEMTMAAYLFANIEVTDPVGYEDYRTQVPATIRLYGGRYLARAGATESLEGEWVPARVVILEFPTMAQLQAWYHSLEYRPLLELRQRTAKSTLIATEGL